eukprot:TRINITY_DN9149_c0_g1_i1.p1 TRINITY_DN9149_c0_g1~~TRINITY_DN9149_c0_g1_i1.p1  ORF type:complete len:486 (+),score=-91.79 TRINITY_DN9149_c0_g1_i1:60-1517(+)
MSNTTSKILKYCLLSLLIIGTIVGLLFFAGYLLLQRSEVKSFISQLLSSKLDRKVEIRGQLYPILYPYLGVAAKDIHIQNPKNFLTESTIPPDFIKLGTLSVRMNYYALLRGNLLPQRLTVKDLFVHFAQKNKVANWSLPQDKPETGQKSLDSSKDTHSSTPPIAALFAIETNLENANFYWHDLQHNTTLAFTHIFAKNTQKDGNILSSLNGSLQLPNTTKYTVAAHATLIPHRNRQLETQVDYFTVQNANNNVPFTLSGTANWQPEKITANFTGGFTKTPTLFLTAEKNAETLQAALKIRGLDLGKISLLLLNKSVVTGNLRSDTTFISTGNNTETLLKHLQAKGSLSVMNADWQGPNITQTLHTYLSRILPTNNTSQTGSNKSYITCSAEYLFTSPFLKFTTVQIESEHLLGTGTLEVNTHSTNVSGKMQLTNPSYTHIPLYLQIGGTVYNISVTPDLSRTLAPLAKQVSFSGLQNTLRSIIP